MGSLRLLLKFRWQSHFMRRNLTSQDVLSRRRAGIRPYGRREDVQGTGYCLDLPNDARAFLPNHNGKAPSSTASSRPTQSAGAGGTAHQANCGATGGPDHEIMAPRSTVLRGLFAYAHKQANVPNYCSGHDTRLARIFLVLCKL